MIELNIIPCAHVLLHLHTSQSEGLLTIVKSQERKPFRIILLSFPFYYLLLKGRPPPPLACYVSSHNHARVRILNSGTLRHYTLKIHTSKDGKMPRSGVNISVLGDKPSWQGCKMRPGILDSRRGGRGKGSLGKEVCLLACSRIDQKVRRKPETRYPPVKFSS